MSRIHARKRQKIENCRTEIFRAKSCPLNEEEVNSGRSTPNGIYDGSIGSDNVFRGPEEQAAWYQRPKWARWNPEEPQDLNEQCYTAASPQLSIAGGSAVVPVKGASSFHTCPTSYDSSGTFIVTVLFAVILSRFFLMACNN